jgi:hypothetical protein
LETGGGGGNFNGLRSSGDGEFDRDEAAVVDVDEDAGDADRLEAGGGDFDSVGADGDGGEDGEAFDVGVELGFDVGGDADKLDAGGGDWEVGGVGDGNADRAGVGLGKKGEGKENEQRADHLIRVPDDCFDLVTGGGGEE